MNSGAESTNPDPATTPTTGTVVSQLMLGFMTTQLVNAALRFELPDRIGDGVRDTGDLAAETATQQRALTRLLRGLSAIGITEEQEPGRFSLTAVGQRLRSDSPKSLHAMAKVFTDESMSRAWYDLAESVRTGAPAFDQIYGTDYYSHLATDPELSRLFNEAHGQGTRRAAESLARSYDFSTATTIMDIGGGDGTLIAAILSSTPGPKGIVFDTATGVDATADTLAAAGVAERCEVRTGDFLDEVPAGADVYVLKSVLHNWNDDQVRVILRNCRKAIPPHGRLVIVDPVLPRVVDPAAPPFAYFSDLNMLVNLGGGEHTEAEFEELLADCGFALRGVRPLPDAPNLGLSIIEASPA